MSGNQIPLMKHLWRGPKSTVASTRNPLSPAPTFMSASLVHCKICAQGKIGHHRTKFNGKRDNMGMIKQVNELWWTASEVPPEVVLMRARMMAASIDNCIGFAVNHPPPGNLPWGVRAAPLALAPPVWCRTDCEALMPLIPYISRAGAVL